MNRQRDYKHNPPHQSDQFAALEQLAPDQAREEAATLRDAIDYHDVQYYIKNRPRISDARYDALFRRLQELEKRFPEARDQNSPTRRVGAKPASKAAKVGHEAPMLSLEAALEEEKVHDFFTSIQRRFGRQDPVFTLEPKFDGLSVELVYTRGRFTRGATRGDGDTGEDITNNLRTIRTVPLRLQADGPPPGLLAVRGEIYMTARGFQDLNQNRVQNGLEPFANARNAAAGIVRQLDPANVADKPLDIVVYDILALEGETLDTQQAAFRQMQAWGLKTDTHTAVATSFDEISEYYHTLSGQRDSLDFDIDGVVIKLDRFDQRREAGTRQRTPRWAFAWKFEPKEEITILNRIAVQVGRTGKLTPVALLDPVNVGGVTVSRATLHNADEVSKKDVRAGDRVRIARAGDVIPEVVERIQTPGVKRSDPFQMPAACPACGGRIEREGAYHVCSANLSCPPQVIGGIIHYGSREAADIEGLGYKTARALYRQGLVRDIADLYRLSADDIRTLPGFAEKSARLLHEAIANRRRLPLDRFLYALGIRHVGQHAAGVLARHFKRFSDIRSADARDLETIHEIGTEIARSVARFFNRRENRQVLEKLFEAGMQVEDIALKQTSRTLQDKTFVFTGGLDSLTRRQAQERVERLGGRAVAGLSHNTDYVVVGHDPGGKYDQAKEMGITIIDEEEFLRLIES